MSTTRTRKFRPAAIDNLEDRTVPSGFDGFNIGASLPVQDARAVARAFDTFGQSYAKDVQTILYSAGVSTVPTSTARAAFDAQVATDLNTLNTTIDAAIANITQTANPTLVQTIHDDLLGSASTTLQSQLAAIATPTTTGWRAERIFISQSWNPIGSVDRTVVNLVRNATPPAGTISQSTVQTLLKTVNTAFQNFSQGYFNAVQTAATSPATNRTAFDAQVATLLGTLNTSIAGAITTAGLPTPSSLDTLSQTVTNDLLTGTQTTGNSLQARLAALASPSSTTGWAGRFFNIRSLVNIYYSQATVSHDIIAAINTYNSSLTG